MNIMMASADYKSAPIDKREKISFTKNRVREIIRNIKKEPHIKGAVLISTCNRTELYISCEEGEEVNPDEILCREAGACYESYKDIFIVKKNESAVQHLMEVACGLRSMILCEDQIISQVKSAALTAWEEKTSDAILQTLFRLAVTCGKKAKTKIRVKAVPTSVAEKAVCLLNEKCGLKGKNVLVIGNGEMGRICASKLVEMGAHVTLTLRTYKHNVTIVPYGCSTIPYDERSSFFKSADIVISATASPHYTVTRDMLSEVQRCIYMADLAVPRDIDPDVEGLSNVTCYNIDDMCENIDEDNMESIEGIKEIIREEKKEFLRWYNMHMCQDSIKLIKNAALKRVNGGLGVIYGYDNKEIIEKAVYKTIDICLHSLKDEITPEFLETMKMNMIKK